MKETWIVIAVLACAINGFDVSDALENNTKSGVGHVGSTQKPYYSPISSQGIENFTRWHVNCDEPQVDGARIGCVLIYCNDSSPKNSTKPLEYHFNLLPKFPNSIIVLEGMKVYRLDDKFLVVWIDYNKDTHGIVSLENKQDINVGMLLNFILIPMETSYNSYARHFNITGTDYQSGLTDHHILARNYVIYLNKDSFDIFYAFNNNLEWAQERFGTRSELPGRRIHGPMPRKHFHGSRDTIFVASYSDVTNGKIQNRERYVIRKICQDQILCNMTEFDVAQQSWSTANDYVTSCKKSSSINWECNSRFSDDQSSNFNMTFRSEPSHFMISNLPNRVVLAVTTQKIPDGGLSVSTTAFGVDRRKYKSVDFYKIDRVPSYISAHVFQDEREGVCLSLSWGNYTDRNNKSKCEPRELMTVEAS